MPIQGMLHHVIVIHETTVQTAWNDNFWGPKIINSLVIQKPLDLESVVVKAPSRRLASLKLANLGVWQISAIGAAFFNSFSSKPCIRVIGFGQQCQPERFLIKVLKERVHFKNMLSHHVTAILDSNSAKADANFDKYQYWWKTICVFWTHYTL